MANLETLVTDRSQSDVQRLLYLINKICSGLATEEDFTNFLSDRYEGLSCKDGEIYLSDGALRLLTKSTYWKGAYNASDINRVAEHLIYLSDRLSECGYNTTIDSDSEWGVNDYFTTFSFSVYLSDIEKIRSTLAVLPTTPETPTLDKFDYNKANDIEKILLDVDFLITQTMNNWLYSGEIASGEV